MTDQCIVCLEDLDELNPDHLHLNDASAHASGAATVHNDQHVARITTCGHFLHDACIKEWTSKANSCPICRTVFHLVQVYDQIGGQLLSERVVEDKKQVADFDPAAWIDQQIPEDTTPCPICGSSNEEEVLLLCDGCDAPYHTHCVGLDRVPSGAWWCMECVHQGADQRNAQASRLQRLSTRTQPRTAAQRTQAQVRRSRNIYTPQDTWHGAWTQIVNRVGQTLDMDLEYGEEDEAMFGYRVHQSRHDRERRDFRNSQQSRQWQQRIAIAERAGAREVLEAAPYPHITTQTTPAISAVERRAWEAVDRMLEGNNSPLSTGRKRKRASQRAASPCEPVEPERKIKRPKPRRVIATAESSVVSTGAPAGLEASPIDVAEPHSAGSFLSSLLREVEAPQYLEDDLAIPTFAAAGSPATEMFSPNTSPVHTPRARSATPPPIRNGRPGSPLTSRVEPVYPRANYSPPHSTTDAPTPVQKVNSWINNIGPDIQHPRPTHRLSELAAEQARSQSPPFRVNISLERKEGIADIVRSALAPHYKKADGGITKDQYASINQVVSRMLYDKIPDQHSLSNEDNRRTWKDIATAEVAKAVESLSG